MESIGIMDGYTIRKIRFSREVSSNLIINCVDLSVAFLRQFSVDMFLGVFLLFYLLLAT